VMLVRWSPAAQASDAAGPARGCGPTDMTEIIFFYVFAAMTLVGGLLTVTRRSAVHSAIWLILSLSGVAGLYLLQHAEFLFAVQIVLYVGGVMVLFLFVIMLVNLDQAAKVRQFNGQWLVALVAVVLVGAEILYFLSKGAQAFRLGPSNGHMEPAAALNNPQMIGDVLFRQYLVPFELASILLLVAVVGAVMMARPKRSA
jgi:NADH-quinone oxidoreductase subunit J